MAVESRHQPQRPDMPYDSNHLRYPAPPQFTNPWDGASQVSSQNYSLTRTPTSLDTSRQLQSPGLTLPPYQSLPVASSALTPSPSLQTSFGNGAGIQAPQDLLNQQRNFTQYPTTTSAAYSTTTAGYPMELPSARTGGYAFQSEVSRRQSHPSVTS